MSAVKAKKPRVSAATRKMVNEWHLERARAIRSRRRERLVALLAKNKIETYGDIGDLLYGLTSKQRDQLAARYIMTAGIPPVEMIDSLKPKKKSEATHG